MPLKIDVVTIFPELFPGPLAASIPGRALERGLASLAAHDLREWGLGKHKSVDDYPYGGGAGMVLRVEPIAGALDKLAGPETTRILMDPGGEVFDQAMARRLAEKAHLLFVCPRYEGVDDRVRAMVDLELSVGDYVVSGGELPAMIVIDARVAAAARRHRRGVAGRGEFFARTARVPAVHAPGGVSRRAGAGRAGQRRPWGRGSLAPGEGFGPNTA